MSIFFIFTTFDMASRGNVMKMSDTFEFRQKTANQYVKDVRVTDKPKESRNQEFHLSIQKVTNQAYV